MANTVINFLIDDALKERIEGFRFNNRFPRRADAIRWLIEDALNRIGNEKHDSIKEMERRTELMQAGLSYRLVAIPFDK